MTRISTNYQEMHDNIVKAGVGYLEKHDKVKNLIIGLSGGIDSTLTAVLARDICDATGKHRLIGFSIPTASNKKSEVELAAKVGRKFCHEFKQVNWFKWLFLKDKVPFRKYERKVRSGNMKARARMMYLYHMAHKYNGLVLSTDNLTEYHLGFWTLHGDVGDLGLIQNLWKTEAYGLANFISSQLFKWFAEGNYVDWLEFGVKSKIISEVIVAVPTDGLGITESDFDQLGVRNYKEADKILVEYIYDKNTKWADHPIAVRYRENAFKRTNPHNIPREVVLPGPKPVNL